jgi:alkanesulfonate monooxygenase SsuD/methylene tetrahydromethanopterin reductase-like flavin-dependent oxidoreductase (luciferase family)
MRAIWREEVASFEGEFARFAAIRVNPKPRRGRIPIIVGGNSDAALARAASWGDGWYGFYLAGVDAVRERLTTLHAFAREAGRDPRELEVAVALTEAEPADVAGLADAGVTQLVLVEAPPADPVEARHWTRALADRWL